MLSRGVVQIGVGSFAACPPPGRTMHDRQEKRWARDCGIHPLCWSMGGQRSRVMRSSTVWRQMSWSITRSEIGEAPPPSGEPPASTTSPERS